MEIKERRKELINTAKEIQDELFQKQIILLQEEYKKEHRRKEAITMFADLFRQWNEQEKRNASKLGICYLHTSVVSETYILLLLLYGDEFYLDDKPMEMSWNLSSFFDMFKDDMNIIMKGLKNDYPRIRAYEEEAIAFAYIPYYYAGICKLCEDLKQEIYQTEEFRSLKKTDDFTMFFGRYLGEGKVL